MTVVTLPWWEVLVRLLAASVCGGIIGIDRGKKHRPAGFRTHMLVCMGAALTILLSTYLCAMLTGSLWNLNPGEVMITTDVSRFGAQVINGIGFIGAGTIIITGRQQVKGLTPAAGLWASACMGLAIGAGFYTAALIACVLIILTIVVFSRLEAFVLAHSRNINLYVEYESTEDLSQIIGKIKSQDIRIFDVEISKARSSETQYPNAIFSLQLPKKKPHTVVMTAIAEIETVRAIEEL